MSETWKDVLGYEGRYQISDLGRFRSVDHVTANYNNKRRTRRCRGKLFTPRFSGKYLAVGLRKDRKLRTREIHRIVLETFVGPCPAGMEACHRNGDHHDNRLVNLRWDTRRNNRRDDLVNKTRKRGLDNPQTKFDCKNGDIIRSMYASGDFTQEELAWMYGVGQTLISRVVRGIRGCDHAFY